MQERRDAMLLVLGRHGMQPVGRAYHQPEGTIFLMAALPPWWSGDDATFANEALARGCFSCIPGSAFGLPGAVRFSYGATSVDDVERLDAQLAALCATIA
jgi:aspartate/methionine/tyrosine aminotransferase